MSNHTGEPLDHASRWREQTLRQTLWITAALGGVAYVPGMLAAWSSRLWHLVGIATLAWLLVSVLAVAHRIPFRWRALAFLSLWLLVACYLLWRLGPVGSGTIWLLCLPTLGALFFGFRGVTAGTGTLVLIALAYGFGVEYGLIRHAEVGTTYAAPAWLSVSGSLVFLSLLMSLAVARQLRGLERTTRSLDASNQRLTALLEERVALQEQIVRNQKLSALGTLVSGIAHDFNNLLVPILALGEEARSAAESDDLQQRRLDGVVSSARRAQELVQRILAYGRSDPRRQEPTLVEPLLSEVCALLRSAAPANVAVRWRSEAPDGRVLAAPGELHQILMNLGTNAVLAMQPKGGELDIVLRRDRQARRLQLEVRDTGVGIPEAIRERIFDPFYSTRAPGEGSGLGLAIVARAVSDMGGTVTVASELGLGSTFRLCLPEVTADEGAITDAPDGVPTEPAGAAREERLGTILVVDDEPMVRATAAMVLTRRGHCVIEAESPLEALRQLDEVQTEVDLVITDQTMPGMTGTAMVERMRRQGHRQPVILCSGFLEAAQCEQAAALGVRETLQKPFTRQGLLAAVDRQLGP